MAKQPPHPASPPTDPLIADVWSRTEPKYRRRALILLGINVCLFCGLACVAYWLRTGVVFAPAAANYWEQLAATFHPTAATKYTPTGLSLGPISIEQAPMMILVLGLILAALVSIPVLTAILYRLPSSIPFIAAVGFIAVMPWLAIVLLGSCLLVSVRPFRSRSRFVSALISLLPVVIYFFMASRQSEPAVDVLANPADRIKLMAPLILATIASAIVMGVVLIIARVVNYRPGAISPLLAILFLTPAALFEFQVGRDELHYRLLEKEYGPGSEYFIGERMRDIQRQIREEFNGAVEQEWARRRGTGVSYETLAAIMETRLSLALDSEVGRLLADHRDKAARAAERFVHLFPDSIYAGSALYLQARALDMKVDPAGLRSGPEVVFYDDFPGERSRRAWEKIEANDPQSPPAVVAMLRLAQLDARVEQIDRALLRLDRLDLVFGHAVPGTDSPSREGMMRRKPPAASLGIPVARRVFDGRVLAHRLENNRDPLYGDQPLAIFMTYDPKEADYTKNLESILDRFPGCRLQDNIELELAVAEEVVSARIAALERCVRQLPSSDSLAEAVFRLGVAHFEDKNTSAAQAAFERVRGEFADSIWREQASMQLRKLTRAAVEGA